MMEWQLANAAFLVITTLSTFLVLGLVVKLLVRQVKWSYFGLWMILGIAVTLMQVLGTASPKVTLNAPIPEAPTVTMDIERADLIPVRPMSDFTRKIDEFDAKQDQRIKENQP